MKKYLKYKKGRVLLIVPIYLVTVSIIITIIYKIILINSTKVYLYPYEFHYTEKLEENEFKLVKIFTNKINATSFLSKEDLKNYLKNNLRNETLDKSIIYYDETSDYINLEKEIIGGTIKHRLDYELVEGKVVIRLKKYYEGVS